MLNISYLFQINNDTKYAILLGQYCILSLDKKHRLYIINDYVFNEKKKHVGYFKNNNLLDLEGFPILRCGFAKAFGQNGYKGSKLDNSEIDSYMIAIDNKLKQVLNSNTNIDDKYIVSSPNTPPSKVLFESLIKDIE